MLTALRLSGKAMTGIDSLPAIMAQLAEALKAASPLNPSFALRLDTAYQTLDQEAQALGRMGNDQNKAVFLRFKAHTNVLVSLLKAAKAPVDEEALGALIHSLGYH